MVSLSLTKQFHIIPLIDIQSSAFAKQYELGMQWSLYGEGQGQGPVPASYLVANLKACAQRGDFATNDLSSLHHLGFLFGVYHGSVLSPHTGQLRQGVSTLAFLDHPQAKRGYHAGREYVFVDAAPHECRLSEQRIFARLCESVTEMLDWKDVDATWFFSIGCVLGQLSGQLFPMSQEEHAQYLSPHQAGEDIR